ncbi:MAG: TIM barrel protein [Paracoccaceae bacterium]|nr:TIM barrel protein [Paracoccaceae bacterium]
MQGFSANLGMLWRELPLGEAVAAGARAGFAAVEVQWPYDTPAAELRAACDATGLPLLSLNTRRGETFGTAALPGRGAETRAGVGEAVAYAVEAGARQVHVLAGQGETCEETYRESLAHACAAAAPHGLCVVIEALNGHDVPGYHLHSVGQALETIAAVERPELRLMFDCYHVQVAEGDVTRRLAAALPLIAHIQIAGAPSRGRPDEGELDLAFVLAEARRLGWRGFVGAEYHPGGPTEESLGWMAALGA